jgi:hypothetical protein
MTFISIIIIIITIYSKPGNHCYAEPNERFACFIDAHYNMLLSETQYAG